MNLPIWLKLIIALIVLIIFFALLWLFVMVFELGGGAMYSMRPWFELLQWITVLSAIAAAIAFVWFNLRWTLIFSGLTVFLFGAMMIYTEQIDFRLRKLQEQKYLETMWPRWRDHAEAIFECPDGGMIRVGTAEKHYYNMPEPLERYAGEKVIVHNPPPESANRGTQLGFFPAEAEDAKRWAFDPEKRQPHEEEALQTCKDTQGRTVMEYLRI